jgi:hypothetical protein
MSENPRIRRLTLVRSSDPGDEMRRYRLARLDEIALASPPDPAAARRDKRSPLRLAPEPEPEERADSA